MTAALMLPGSGKAPVTGLLGTSPTPQITTFSTSIFFFCKNNIRYPGNQYQFQHHHQQRQRFLPIASSSSSPYFRNGGANMPPGTETECPVPVDQQPVNEYQSLAASFPFSWAAGDLPDYSSRLFLMGASFYKFVGLPVAWFGIFHPESQPLNCVLGAASSGLFVVTLAVLRMYLGWAYVGNRLLSATVEYEETGWYDGQIWVKTAEVLARDRLLGSYSVKPVLSRLKFTLVGLAASLVFCGVLLFNIEGNQKNSYISSDEAGGRAVPGIYNDESARSFEPDAFCGEPDLL
ncbi:protein CONSERVED IN THE GREEN LINEAGE AND DIATOMS 27, chloroplastic-like [Telopea speciosissima]|uniref:protein CONSERVED IN THE GREEN LINEAGE AND DIATOMS 27, chloroplastic-like n=1 Tax=Telopea speciosissima TaxID=54955 RepID=UPI001CC50A9F|nr:protein CONSERVED IN THE GREEN LINEAGE AND DIATOMS 27, chloroplastic-like [Telopea speciosissima]